MDCWLRETPIVETLLFREHGHVATLEIDVLPAEPLTSPVVPISQYLRAPHARIREEIHQSAVATGLDRCLSIVADVVDCGARLLVDERCELVAVVDRPRLLVTALVTAIIGDRFGRVAALGDVLGEVALTDSPATIRLRLSWRTATQLGIHLLKQCES